MLFLEHYLDYLLQEEANLKQSVLDRPVYRNSRKKYDSNTAKTIGAGAGVLGALGAGTGALVGKKGKKKKAALIGGMIGTGLGAAAGLTTDRGYKNSKNAVNLGLSKLERYTRRFNRREIEAAKLRDKIMS